MPKDRNGAQEPVDSRSEEDAARALAAAHDIPEDQARQLVRTIGDERRALDTAAEAQKRWS